MASTPHYDWTDHDDWSDYSDYSDHTDGGPYSDHTDNLHDDWDDHGNWTDAYSDWTDHDDWTDSYSDWTDHDDHEDAGYDDWTDHDDVGHTDSEDHDDEGYTDWGDHDDDVHGDWDDHDDDIYVDWDDHDDAGHTDWDDHTDHTDGPYSDWDDHDDAGTHLDWTDHCDEAWTDWTDHTDHTDGPYSDWSDYTDADHLNWDDYWDAHADWTDAHTDWADHDDVGGHTDWTNYNDVAYDDWTDHGDWTDVGHEDHTDADPHYDWNDWTDGGGVHVDWDDHTDTGAHDDWDDHDDGGGDPHYDWDDWYDGGGVHVDHMDGVYQDVPYSDWTDHGDWTDTYSDWDDHDDHDDGYSDWDDHNNVPYSDWTDHGDWTDVGHEDHTDADPHYDWDDWYDGGGAHVDWSDHDDWTDTHTDWDDYCDHDHADWDDAHSDWTNHTDGHSDHDDHTDGAHTDWDDYSDSGLDCKTQLTIEIDGIPVGHDAIGADIWRDALNGIGRWEVILNNQGHKWGSTFTPDDSFLIRINGVLMMMGYVDDVHPYLETKGVYPERIKLMGRDYGMDLAQLYLTQEFANQRADDIVAAALVATGSEITYVSPSALPPSTNYEFDRTYLADGIRDLAKLWNYDFYVEDTLPLRRLHFFGIADAVLPVALPGSENTGVALQSVAGAANNILRLEIGETLGFAIKNYVEAHAGPLKDHWTDMNSAAYTAGANNLLSDETTLFLYGKGAIMTEIITAPAPLQCELIFGGPLYEYVTLDLSKQGTGRFAAYPRITGTLFKHTRIRLEDNAGNVIEYYRNTGPIHNRTDSTLNNRWRWIIFPYGEDTEIKAAGTYNSDFWQYVGVAVTFDWSNVEHIRFLSDPNFNQPVGNFMIIDGLELSDIEVRSISQNVTEPPGQRMIDIYRPDIKSQVELDAFAGDELLKYIVAIEKVNATTIGETGTPYAAQGVTVQAPSSGIAAATPYRIFKLHHVIRLSPTENMIPAYDYTTEYELVKHILVSGTQVVDPTRFAQSETPTESRFRQIREQQRYRSPRIP